MKTHAIFHGTLALLWSILLSSRKLLGSQWVLG